jgi:drug/metabolite transporter (DMT)-like permease
VEQNPSESSTASDAPTPNDPMVEPLRLDQDKDAARGSTRVATLLAAALYVSSGICQPLIMTLCQTMGVANHKAQLYMFAYYLGPSMLLFSAFRDPTWPPHRRSLVQAPMIAVLDIFAQTLNYTGASWAGPTVFAIVYSSVTVWTAVFSRIVLSRSLVPQQWMAICLVVGGLCWTATSSVQLGSLVMQGTVLVLVGSTLHGASYVLSEAIMKESVVLHALSPKQNAAIQGTVACVALFLWQVVYTAPHWDEVIGQPARDAGTSWWQALLVLLAFAGANTVHSVSFSHTLKHYPGGATSAGVMKGLQAVLVFGVAHVVYCGKVGGPEMCFTLTKLVSLVSVSGGVAWFGTVTESEDGGARHMKEGYTPVESTSAAYDREMISV